MARLLAHFLESGKHIGDHFVGRPSFQRADKGRVVQVCDCSGIRSALIVWIQIRPYSIPVRQLIIDEKDIWKTEYPLMKKSGMAFWHCSIWVWVWV